jgi:Protein of unknown function (DUF2939)
MRRTILTVAILGVAWIGYMAWPAYDLFVLLRAVEARDIDTATRRIDFNRASFRSRIRLSTLTCAAPESSLIPLGQKIEAIEGIVPARRSLVGRYRGPLHFCSWLLRITLARTGVA